MGYYETLPAVLKISAYDIRLINLLSDEEGDDQVTWGKWSMNLQLIKLKADQPSPYFAVDTLLHEIFHAIWCIYNIKREDDEERSVSTVATAVTDLFRRNPGLLYWLATTLYPMDEIRIKARGRRASKDRVEKNGRNRAGRNPSRKVRRNTRVAASNPSRRRIDKELTQSQGGKLRRRQTRRSQGDREAA